MSESGEGEAREGPNDTMQVQTTRRVRSFVNSTTVGHVHIVTVVVN